MQEQERFQAQLKEFREDDEARWKYEAEELQRQARILEGLMDRTDEEVKAELKKAGINVNVLEEEFEKSAKQVEEAHKELLKIEPPPPKRGRKEQIMMEYVAARASHCTWLYPPAYAGWGNAETCGFNLGLGEINTRCHQQGSGWYGWSSSGHQHCTLWFYYFPPSSGDLVVRPHVDFQGQVNVSAHDLWYLSCHAELQLRLHFDLYQYYWDGEQTATIIDEHRHNSFTGYFVNDHRVMEKNMSVAAGDIVWIKLTSSLDCRARSLLGSVFCDFRTGAARRIKVEHIQVCLT